MARIWDDRYGCPGVYSVERCAACGQMATMPALREADLPALYSAYYPRRAIDFAALEREARLVLRPRASLRRWLCGTNNQGHYRAKQGERVLDIGCGSCLSLLELRHMGVEARGVEADPNVRKIAENFVLDVHIGSIHDVPFAGESFDLITLNQVIEHVPDPRGLLRAVSQRLAAGGRVALSFPNAASLMRRMAGSRWINWHVPYHQHHFNAKSFGRLAQQEGYIVESVQTVTPNVWTLLQLRSLGKPPPEGSASKIWSVAPDAGAAAKSKPALTLRTSLRRGIHRLADALFTVANRLIDAFGLGDSLVVVLRKV